MGKKWHLMGEATLNPKRPRGRPVVRDEFMLKTVWFAFREYFFEHGPDISAASREITGQIFRYTGKTERIEYLSHDKLRRIYHQAERLVKDDHNLRARWTAELIQEFPRRQAEAADREDWARELLHRLSQKE